MEFRQANKSFSSWRQNFQPFCFKVRKCCRRESAPQWLLLRAHFSYIFYLIFRVPVGRQKKKFTIYCIQSTQQIIFSCTFDMSFKVCLTKFRTCRHYRVVNFSAGIASLKLLECNDALACRTQHTRHQSTAYLGCVCISFELKHRPVFRFVRVPVASTSRCARFLLQPNALISSGWVRAFPGAL